MDIVDEMIDGQIVEEPLWEDSDDVVDEEETGYSIVDEDVITVPLNTEFVYDKEEEIE
jgi:hypothetical protein